jgi:predicted Ser/Thr protein kinase
MGRKCLKCHFESVDQAQVCGRCGAPLPRPGTASDPALTTTMGYASGNLSDGVLFANRYLVIEELGKGGMGSVYRVLDIKVDEEVALKFLNQDVAADTSAIERFRSELRITRKIAHHNVCRVFDLGEEGKSYFITMEYIAGEDLAHMIKRLGQLPVERGYQIARQVCEGLAEVHSLGIIHRDLKPKNIMIDKDGRAKIMDFGLARSPHGLHLTQAGHVVGTPSYMSPEQLNGEPVDPRSDVFALGVTMYAMLTGGLPFDAETTTTLALQHRTVKPRSPHMLNPHVPEDLSRIILKCLQIDKTARYASAQEVLADLLKAGRRFETYRFSVQKRLGGKLPSLLAKPRAKIAAGAALVLVMALAGLALKSFLAKPGERQPPPPAPVQAPVEKKVAPPVPAAVRVTLNTTPGQAAVEVDGISRDLAGGTFELAPGTHTLKLAKPGYQSYTGTLVVEAGGSGSLVRDYKLVALPPAMGNLDIRSEPDGASVFIGGSASAAGRTPYAQAVPPGRVTVKLRLDGYQDFVQQVDVRAGQGSSVSGSLVPLSGSVELTSEPSGAELYSGEEYLGATPLARFLAPGVYRLRIVWPDKRESEEVLTVDPGAKITPPAYQPPPPVQALHYFLKVESDPPGASVTINGTPCAEVTPFMVELTTNEVRIKVEKEGYQAREELRYIRPAPARNLETFALKKIKAP